MAAANVCGSRHDDAATGGGSTGKSPTTFSHALPPSRLGRSHASLDSFLRTVHPSLPVSPTGGSTTAAAARQQLVLPPPKSKRKTYSLVVVTDSSRRRMLLGLKRRGFGEGLWNSFGGKLDPGEGPTEGAVRELKEEANIDVPREVMERGRVGTIHFTFDDEDDFEMLVHLFRIDLICTNDDSTSRCTSSKGGRSGLATVRIDASTIRGCDEITPRWFDDWVDMPLDNMFADDSIWLTRLLSCESHFRFDGWFHFREGGAVTNSVMHYHLAVRDGSSRISTDNGGGPPPQFSLEKRLFHELHRSSIHSPTIKEFKECWAFASSVQSHYGKRSFDVVIDVAGGHGALAALLLILTSASHAVVVDPAVVGGREGVRNAWGRFLDGKELRYRNECLRTGLRAELEVVLGTDRDAAGSRGAVGQTRVLVVACHACQHLSDETVEIATEFGVHVAVMPCCQKANGAWKAASKSLGVPIGPLMDILAAGKVMAPSTGRSAGVSYSVKIKQIDNKITPQNRLIMCKAHKLSDAANNGGDETLERAHQRLQRAYERAHRQQEEHPRKGYDEKLSERHVCVKSAAVAFCAGVLLSVLFLQKRQ